MSRPRPGRSKSDPRSGDGADGAERLSGQHLEEGQIGRLAFSNHAIGQYHPGDLIQEELTVGRRYIKGVDRLWIWRMGKPALRLLDLSLGQAHATYKVLEQISLLIDDLQIGPCKGADEAKELESVIGREVF
jgi:hypothetical protein